MVQSETPIHRRTQTGYNTRRGDARFFLHQGETNDTTEDPWLARSISVERTKCLRGGRIRVGRSHKNFLALGLPEFRCGPVIDFPLSPLRVADSDVCLASGVSRISCRCPHYGHRGDTPVSVLVEGLQTIETRSEDDSRAYVWCVLSADRRGTGIEWRSRLPARQRIDLTNDILEYGAGARGSTALTSHRQEKRP